MKNLKGPPFQAQRLSINARERRRMHDLNDAMDELRGVIPYAHSPSVRKLSKPRWGDPEYISRGAQNTSVGKPINIDMLLEFIGFLRRMKVSCILGTLFQLVWT